VEHVTRRMRNTYNRATGDRATAEILGDAVEAAYDAGVIPHAELVLSSQPTTGDTIGIGADTYQFRAAAAAVTNNGYIAVAIGGSAALTRAALIAAINATYDDNEHPNITNIATTAPAKANGTERVRAYQSGTSVVIEPTQKSPGEPEGYPSNPSIVLAEAITAGADVWVEGNVNLNTLGGRAGGLRRQGRASLTVSAAMITATGRHIKFPFTPTMFTVQVRKSDGGERQTDGGDVFAISGDGVLWTAGGGAAPDVQASDTIHVHAWE
jgi:hypothetical protein